MVKVQVMLVEYDISMLTNTDWKIRRLLTYESSQINFLKEK